MSTSEIKIKIIKPQKRIVNRKKSPNRNNQKKFDQLYENYKTRKEKNELLKQKILSEREKKNLTECTFTPHINKKKIIFDKKPFNYSSKTDIKNNKQRTPSNLNIESNIVNLVNRQNKWLENKTNKLKKRIVTETMKNMEKYVFEPKIQKLNKRTLTNFNTETHKIIRKPDSYLNYINKNRQFRKNKTNSLLYEYPLSKGLKSPIKNNLLKLNRINDYDYTKHQLTERSTNLKNRSTSNFNKNISFSKSNKSFNTNNKKPRRKSIPLTKLKVNNVTVDELYKMVYIREKEKINENIKDHTNENIELLFKGKDKVLFKQAIERLHTILIDLNLDNEKGVENDDSNRIDNLID